MTSHGALSCLFCLLTTSQPSSPGTEGSAAGAGLGPGGRGRGRCLPSSSVRTTTGASSQALVHLCVSDGRDAVLRPLVQRLQQDLGGGRGDAVPPWVAGPPSKRSVARTL